MKRIMTASVLIASSVLAYVSGYRVEPTTADFSSKVAGVAGVGEVVTCCWDSLAYVELFAGYVGDTNSKFSLDVIDEGTSEVVAHKYNVTGLLGTLPRFLP